VIPGGTINKTLAEYKLADSQEQFCTLLADQLDNLVAPYAVFCVSMADSPIKLSDKPDCEQDSFVRLWQKSVAVAIKMGTCVKPELLRSGCGIAAVILAPCDYDEAGKLARITRAHLMHMHSSLRPKIAVSQINTATIDVQSVLSQLRCSLEQNIMRESSKIEVRRFPNK